MKQHWGGVSPTDRKETVSPSGQQRRQGNQDPDLTILLLNSQVPVQPDPEGKEDTDAIYTDVPPPGSPHDRVQKERGV